LSFVVLHPSREMWFLAMGGSTSYWSLSTVSTTSRTSSSTTWSGSCQRHWLLQIYRLAQEKTGAANVPPALVNATRKIGPLYLQHLHPHRGITCRRNTPAALCSPGSSRTTSVGDRPRGPLKQWGNPYLNSCIKIS
jgi:hypothetical protein